MWIPYPAPTLLCLATLSSFRSWVMPALGQWLSPCVLLPFSPPLTPCARLIPLYLPGPPSRATHLFIGPLLSKRCLCSAKRGLLLPAAGVCGTSPAPLVLRSPFWGLLCLLALLILLLLLPDALRWMGRDVWLSQQPSCPLPPKLPLAMPKDPVPVPVPPPHLLHPSRFRPSPLVSLAKP